MKATDAIVCIRVSDAAAIADGSREVPCSECGEPVWRASGGLAHEYRGGRLIQRLIPAGTVPLCAQCALVSALEQQDADAAHLIRTMLGW